MADGNFVYLTRERIVEIEKEVPPCEVENCLSYGGHNDSLYVVEVVSGFSEKYGVKVGDLIELKNIA